jgi:hypothetical protein
LAFEVQLQRLVADPTTPRRLAAAYRAESVDETDARNTPTIG